MPSERSTSPAKRRATRASAITTFALIAASYQIVWGEAARDAGVFTFLSGLLLALIAAEIDEARRKRR